MPGTEVASQRIVSINPLGRRTSTIYDAAGRAVASINALGYRTTNVYNVASQGVGAITALGQRMTQVYDSAGRGGHCPEVVGHPVAFASRQCANEPVSQVGYDGASGSVSLFAKTMLHSYRRFAERSRDYGAEFRVRPVDCRANVDVRGASLMLQVQWGFL